MIIGIERMKNVSARVTTGNVITRHDYSPHHNLQPATDDVPRD
jgi:hypothetical protein